jgi:hypothetical protein
LNGNFWLRWNISIIVCSTSANVWLSKIVDEIISTMGTNLSAPIVHPRPEQLSQYGKGYLFFHDKKLKDFSSVAAYISAYQNQTNVLENYNMQPHPVVTLVIMFHELKDEMPYTEYIWWQLRNPMLTWLQG